MKILVSVQISYVENYDRRMDTRTIKMLYPQHNFICQAYWSQTLQKALDILDLRSVIYQLQLITTWGDPYYVGLNGLQFYDAQHNRIELTESSKLYVCLFMMILIEVYIYNCIN